jgi:tRNA(fMet)-specific endonuclease VapC
MDYPRICIDTGVLIRYLRGQDPSATAVERAVRESDCSITSITAYEILFGLARSQRSIGEEDLLDALAVLPFDLGASRRAAALHDELIRRNQDIGVKDVMIAAVCLSNDLPLLTLNARHFERVAGLAVVGPERLVLD